MNKYELTDEAKVVYGTTLYRIKALKDFSNVSKGELGGFIEKEANLSQTGDAWVSGNAWVFGNAKVSGNAWVFGNAKVSGDAEVFGNAKVSGDAEVFGNAKVSGDAEVFGNAKVTKKATNLIANTWTITITDKHIQIGCKQFTFKKFMKLHKNFSKIKSQFREGDLRTLLPYRKVIVELVKLAILEETN